MLEATAWQTLEVVEAMNVDAGMGLSMLRVDGGMTANNLLMQFLADVLDVPVVRPIVAETVSLGAAYAAGLAVGFWPDTGALQANWHKAAEWLPQMDPRQAGARLPQVAQGGRAHRRLARRGRRGLVQDASRPPLVLAPGELFPPGVFAPAPLFPVRRP